jgi:hypothetical protein
MRGDVNNSTRGWIRKVLVLSLIWLGLLGGMGSAVVAQHSIEDVLPESSVLLWKVHPVEVVESNSWKLFPWEAVGAISSDELGIDLLRIPELYGACELSSTLSWDGSICFSPIRSTDIANLNSQNFGPIRTSELYKNVRLRSWRASDLGVLQMENRWLAGSQSSLKKMLRVAREPHRLSKVLNRQKSSIVILLDVKQLKLRLPDHLKVFELSPLTEAAVLLKQICDLVDHVECRIELGEQTSLEIRWVAADVGNVAQVSGLIDRILKFGGEAIGENGADMFRWSNVDGVPPDVWAAYWRRMLGNLSVTVSRRVDENSLITRLDNVEELILIFGLAVMSPNPLEGIQESLPRSRTELNLEELAIAIQGYESVHRRIPPRAVRDKDGKLLLSWRVLLLPYLGQEELYSQFRLDEAWDSEHNKKLLDKMPAVFANPNSELQPGHTSYLAPFGYADRREQTAWDIEPLLLRQVSDGLANTAAIVEVAASSAVPWTKPEDFDLKERELMEFLGEPPVGGLVVMLDGTSYDLSGWKDKRRLKGVLTVNGGEAVTAPF